MATLDQNALLVSNDMNDIPIQTHVLFDVMLAVFILFSLLLNILISNVYYRNGHIITHQGVLVIILTVVNLLWTIGIFPFSLAAGVVSDPADASVNGLWIFQDPVCGIVGFGNAFIPLGKLFTVILMLWERSVAILLEPHYKRLMSKWLFSLAILAAWFMAFLCGVLPPAMGFFSEISPGKGTCFPPLNVYAALVFYFLFLAGGITFILLMSRKRERATDTDPLPSPPSAPHYAGSVRTAHSQHGFMSPGVLSPTDSTGIVMKSPLKRELLANSKRPDKDLVDYDLHTGKSKLSKEYNGVLALFTLYAIVYLPFAICSVVQVPTGLDNVATLLLYSTTWLEPLLLILTRVLLRRALDRMCFEVCCVELQCCARKNNSKKQIM